jgi:hypothetical protein
VLGLAAFIRLNQPRLVEPKAVLDQPMDPSTIDPHHYEVRAEECCCYAITARSISEKEAWLKIAEVWLVFARLHNEADLPRLAQRDESGPENQVNTDAIVGSESSSIEHRSHTQGMLDANHPSEGKSRRSPLLARAFALHSAEQRHLNRLRHPEKPISKVDSLDLFPGPAFIVPVESADWDRQPGREANRGLDKVQRSRDLAEVHSARR